MNFELTDLLTCPACGPDHGLVLLVESVEDRKVSEGWLGCPNCRTNYRVEAGVADLRRSKSQGTEADAGRAQPFRQEETPLKIAALSGLTEGPARILLGPRLSDAAEELVELLPGVEIIAVSREPIPASEREEVSYVISDSGLPLARYGLQAVALATGDDPESVTAAAVLIRAGGRLVLFEASERDREAVRETGLSIVASEHDTIVAERSA